MPSHAPIAAFPPDSSLALDRPESVASRCHQLGLPGLVWLDSAMAGPKARSLIAACPEETMTGGPSDWGKFESRLEDFRQAHPAGAVVGWVEYEGRFQFGFYEQPLIFDHTAARWLAPGGRPSWLASCGSVAAGTAPWHDQLHFTPEMTAAQFCRQVEAAQAHIAAGDIYQVNLAHRLNAPWPVSGDAMSLYRALRMASPAPHSAFLALDSERTVLCSSPEEFLTFRGRQVSTRPIKGTRPRGSTPEADQAAAREFVDSPKERAELLMITDLLRNDLGQFCEYGSVRVKELFRVERFAQVLHLVSTVEGRLREGVTHAEALRLCLPGGSITGAPKRRAREIIAELENGPRGLYTGTIGAFLGDEESWFNMVIRTLVIEGGTAHFHVGAGIVADSQPPMEWEETLHKAAGILRASSSGTVSRS